MKEKYMKIKQLKIGIQMIEAAMRKLDECGFVYGYRLTNNIAMDKVDFFNLAKALHIDPIIVKNYSSDYKSRAHFIFEGKELYCIYNEPTFNKWGLKKLENRFKEIFFETEDRELAFQKLKEEVLASYDGKYKSKQPIFWMQSNKDFEKYLNRHRRENESYESRYSKYLKYRDDYEPLDGDISCCDAKRMRPNDDWLIPMSFKQWNKANY